jgi:putative phosphoribosyl transferase
MWSRTHRTAGTKSLNTRFRDRDDAGHVLAGMLAGYRGEPNLLVLALPRGGVPVAYPIALELDAPLDILLVRKLGLPEQPELAMGAIASGGVRILNPEVVDSLRVPAHVIEAVTIREQQELERRERAYRGNTPAAEVRGQTAIVVDDGLATGSTMRAAVESLRRRDPASVIVAVPAAAPSVCEALQEEADKVVCAITPEPFAAVGLWYDNFLPVDDSEVRRLLESARQRFQRPV